MKEIDRAASIFLRAVLRRMKDLGLNQTSLAARMNASRPYVTKVLNGDVSITLRTASRFAKALQMDFLPELRERASGDCGAVGKDDAAAMQFYQENADYAYPTTK